MRVQTRYGVAALMLVLAGSGAAGQTAPSGSAAQPPVGAEPAATTATYGDWVLRCQSKTIAGAPTRICEVVQTMQRQNEPVAQLAFGRTPGSAGLHVVVALPVSVVFPSSVTVSSGETDRHPLELSWKRCIPGACFADATADAETVSRWRSAASTGAVHSKDASNRDLILPVSFRGLGQALDALGKAP